jgi:hypothetical protein
MKGGDEMAEISPLIGFLVLFHVALPWLRYFRWNTTKGQLRLFCCSGIFFSVLLIGTLSPGWILAGCLAVAYFVILMFRYKVSPPDSIGW